LRSQVFAKASTYDAPVKVRLAETEDVEALRAVHVRTWADTYRGLLPQSVFAERLVEHAHRDWAERVRSQEAAGGGVIALIDDDDVVGLCQYGPTEDRDDEPDLIGHVHRLFVDPLHQGRGGGRLFLTRACDALRLTKMQAATLWVLEKDERARRFYEHMGWRYDGGQKGVDVRYRFPLSPPAT
jgi:GNAT superfamily N-acetyltransferase